MLHFGTQRGLINSKFIIHNFFTAPEVIFGS